MTTQEIKIMVHNAIPLDPTCEVARKAQIAARAAARALIEELIREGQLKPYEPRTQLKNDTY